MHALDDAVVYLKTHRGARVLLLHDTEPTGSRPLYGGTLDVCRISQARSGLYDAIFNGSCDERARLAYYLRYQCLEKPEHLKVPYCEEHGTW